MYVAEGMTAWEIGAQLECPPAHVVRALHGFAIRSASTELLAADTNRIYFAARASLYLMLGMGLMVGHWNPSLGVASVAFFVVGALAIGLASEAHTWHRLGQCSIDGIGADDH